MSDITLDTDLASMTVAQLRKALKDRGLTSTGVKQDLIDRLQLSLATEVDPNNDTDLLEDANELLGDDDDETPVKAATPKKVAINRNNTETKPAKAVEAAEAVSKSPEAEPSKVANEANDKEKTSPAPLKTMTDAERAAARAARFGASDAASVDKKQARAERFGLSAKIGAAPTADLETLRKRAERFGQSSSTVMKKAELDEKIKKRQERFGAVEPEKKKMKKGEILSNIGLNSSLKAPQDEKLSKRAERFGLKV